MRHHMRYAQPNRATNGPMPEFNQHSNRETEARAQRHVQARRRAVARDHEIFLESSILVRRGQALAGRGFASF
jgi:hypothetical protein